MFDPTSESGPAENGATSKVYESSATSRQSTPSTRQQTTAERLAAVDDILGEVCDALADGTLPIADLWRYSPNAAALFNLGHGYGYQSREDELRQARHDADRMALFAMNGTERATEIQHRLDRQLAACPPTITPHSPEYFEYAMRGVLSGGAA